MDNPTISSPAFALYGDGRIFPDVLHCEAITTRAARHDWKIGRHRHPGLHQFFLIASGGVTVQLASGDRVLLPPVTISMPSKLDHGFVFDAGTVGVVVSVPVAVLDGLAAQGLNRLHIAPAAPRTEAIFTALSSWHADPGGLRDVALRALVTALACDLIHGDAGGIGAPPTLYSRFEAAVRHHAADGWRVADYAACLGTSATQLNRVVRAQADQSVMGAVQDYLMGEAARRLAYTRQSVTALAYDMGFSDPAYFARAFRKAFGVSPRAYRQQFG
jgi:AraC family transcriptional activator of pobA